MRFFTDPFVSIAYLLGVGVKGANNKVHNAIDKRDKRKKLESALDYISSSEKEREQKEKKARRREKRAGICLAVAILGFLVFMFAEFLIPLFHPTVAKILFISVAVASVVSVIYGLWYSIWGQYL